MPRVKKKSVEYGNRKRRKLAAAKRSIYYHPLMYVDRASSPQQRVQQMTTTGSNMPPTPPLTSPDTTDEFKPENEFKDQDDFPKKIENDDSKCEPLSTGIKIENIKTEKIETEIKTEVKTEEEYHRHTRPIKGLKELLSNTIITADAAAAAVTAVTTMASLQKSIVEHMIRTQRKPKPMKKTIKVSLPGQKVPVLPKPPKPSTTPVTTTAAAPNNITVNIKRAANSSTTPSGNTQKAYALYVGGQLKYILPYNGPLGAINSSQQQNNEMKKLICRGLNGKTEIALAKPTVVCDDEKKKIVFVVQKKGSPAVAPSSTSNTPMDNNKIVRIPSLATLSTTSGQSLKGNQIISDNMLKLLLPAASASINTNTPITLPSQIPGNSGVQVQSPRTNPQQTTSTVQQTPNKVLAPLPPPLPPPTSTSSVPMVVKALSNVISSMATATTKTININTNTSSLTLSSSSSSSVSSTTPTTITSTSTSTSMANVTPQTSPISSSSNSPGSIRPVQLFTRDSARSLCSPPGLSPGNKPCMTIVDPSDPEANIRPGKSLLGGNSENTPNLNLVKKTGGEGSIIVQLKDSSGVTSLLNISHNDPKTPDKNSSYTNDAQLQPNPQTISLSNNNNTQTETMPPNVSSSTCEDESNANDDADDDDGMFGFKISSVFSLADNQQCSSGNEAAAIIEQERNIDTIPSPSSFQQNQTPTSETLTTAMKLVVNPEEAKTVNRINNEGQNSTPTTNQRTLIFNLNTDHISSPSQGFVQILPDTSPSKQNSLLKSSVTKSLGNMKIEPQPLAAIDPDLESVLSGKLSVDAQTVPSQKENASPKKGASLAGPEKDFLPGQKYITVDIFRHNGQTKITAVSSCGKKETTKPSLPNGNSDGASGSSDESKSTFSTSDPRVTEVLQCAAYSLPMGTYFFIPLADKIVAIPSTKRNNKKRSAYVFDKSQNFMQVKMAKYMVVGSKDKSPPTSVGAGTGSSQLLCQVGGTKPNGGEPTTVVLPLVSSASPVKETIPMLEAPPIVTGKRIRRPKKLMGFEEDVDLRKYRTKLKPVNKTEKNSKEQNDRNSQSNKMNFETLTSGNKLILQPVESKEEISTALRSVDLAKAISQNTNSKMPIVYIHPSGPKAKAFKIATPPVSSSNESSFHETSQSGLHIDNVQSLQPSEGGTIRIKSEPITSGYGDEPVMASPPLPSIISPAQVGHDALGNPLTIKKEPSWYDYGQDPSAPPILYRMNSTLSGSHTDHISTPTDMNSKNATFGSHMQFPPTSNKKDSPTKSPTGKKRGRKKKDPDEWKPVVKKRKYVRHKTETVVGASTAETQTQISTPSTSSNLSLKKEIKTEPPEPSSTSSLSGETSQEERIRRLKEILREKQQKLEEIRLNMSVSSEI